MTHRPKKSQPEPPIQSPIAFRPCSNGEYCPPPKTERDARAEARYREIVETKSRRLGMSRREFSESACGVAAALLLINQTYGCSSSGDGTGVTGPGTVDGGGSGGGGGVGQDAAGFDVDANMMEDSGAACEALMGDEFIFDVQTHTPMPLSPWRDSPLPVDAETYINTVFVDSDTTMVVISGVPGSRGGGIENVEARRQLQDVIDRLGGPRLVFHANADPTRGPSELDYMEQVAGTYDVAAWKVYPHFGPWRLDDQQNGAPLIAKARELGVRVIAAHRGIAGDAGGYQDPSSPVDLGNAAAANPDIKFLTYHSGWQGNVDEDHPFDPLDPNPAGVDRLIKVLLDNGIGNDGNVYAELGSTWRALMTSPQQAAHVLGKLLLHLGEDRIVWGTDSVFTGSPQEQIVAMRTFQIPQSLQDMHGYPALTDAIRAKIFGLNAADAYGVDPTAVRCAIQDDFVDRLRTAHLADPASSPVPKEKSYGPRNRREFLDFLRWEHYLDHG